LQLSQEKAQFEEQLKSKELAIQVAQEQRKEVLSKFLIIVLFHTIKSPDYTTQWFCRWNKHFKRHERSGSVKRSNVLRLLLCKP
jgi:hypothetical protein